MTRLCLHCGEELAAGKKTFCSSSCGKMYVAAFGGLTGHEGYDYSDYDPEDVKYGDRYETKVPGSPINANSGAQWKQRADHDEAMSKEPHLRGRLPKNPGRKRRIKGHTFANSVCTRCGVTLEVVVTSGLPCSGDSASRAAVPNQTT